jgi:hypothetical protein
MTYTPIPAPNQTSLRHSSGPRDILETWALEFKLIFIKTGI